MRWPSWLETKRSSTSSTHTPGCPYTSRTEKTSRGTVTCHFKKNLRRVQKSECLWAFAVASSRSDEYAIDLLIISIPLWNYKSLKLLFLFVDCRYELLPTQNSSFTGDWHFSGNDIMYDDFNHTLVGGVLQVTIVRSICFYYYNVVLCNCICMCPSNSYLSS